MTDDQRVTLPTGAHGIQLTESGRRSTRAAEARGIQLTASGYAPTHAAGALSMQHTAGGIRSAQAMGTYGIQLMAGGQQQARATGAHGTRAATVFRSDARADTGRALGGIEARSSETDVLLPMMTVPQALRGGLWEAAKIGPDAQMHNASPTGATARSQAIGGSRTVSFCLRKEMKARIMKEYPEILQLFRESVPSIMSESVFWHRYFIAKSKEGAGKRAVKRTLDSTEKRAVQMGMGSACDVASEMDWMVSGRCEEYPVARWTRGDLVAEEQAASRKWLQGGGWKGAQQLAQSKRDKTRQEELMREQQLTRRQGAQFQTYMQQAGAGTRGLSGREQSDTAGDSVFLHIQPRPRKGRRRTDGDRTTSCSAVRRRFLQGQGEDRWGRERVDRALEVRRLRGSARLGSGRLQVRLRWVGVNPRTGASWPDTWQDVFYGEGDERRCGVNPSLLKDVRRLEAIKYGIQIGTRSERATGDVGVSDEGGPAHERGTGDECDLGVRGQRARPNSAHEIVLHLTRGTKGYGFSLAAGNGVVVVKKGGAADDAQLRVGDRVVEVQGGKLLEEGGLALEEPQNSGTRLSLTIQRHNFGRKRKWQQSLRSGAVNEASNYEWPVVRRPVKHTAGLSIATSEAGGTLREQRIAAALRDIQLRHLDRRISLAATARSADRRPSSNIQKQRQQRGRMRADGASGSSTGTGARLDGEGRRCRRPDTSESPGGDRPGGL